MKEIQQKTSAGGQAVYYTGENVVITGDVDLNEGVNIWHNTVIRGDLAPIEIGKNTNIQDGCVLHVDEEAPLRVGENVTVGHRAILHGCQVDDDTLIGMGAIVLNHAHIGKGCLIGAGALVLENTEIPAGSLAVGSPCRIIGKVSEMHQQQIRHGMEEYLFRSAQQLDAHPLSAPVCSWKKEL